MGQIKVKPFRLMQGRTESTQKFPHDDLVIEPLIKLNAADHPEQKYSERCDPWPPTGPRRSRFSFAAPPLEYNDAGKQKRINDRALDQHPSGQQTEGPQTVAKTPDLIVSDLLPNQLAEQENHQGQRHVRSDERGETRSEQVKTERAERDHAGDWSVG